MTPTSEVHVGAPAFDVDLFSDEVLSNPHPVYKAMRDVAPVVWIPRYGVYYATEHATARAIFNDWETFSSAGGIGLRHVSEYARDRQPGILLESDPPEHQRFRSVVMKQLSPIVLKAMRATFEAVAKRVMDSAMERRFVDGSTDIIRPFILNAVADVVGVPEQGREHMYINGEIIQNIVGPDNERLRRAMERAREAGSAEWLEKMLSPSALRPDGLGRRFHDAADAGEITPWEARMLVRIFLSAAVDSTSYTMINALKNIADHPDEWAKVVADPGLTKDFFEEVMRYNVAVQVLFRTVTKDVEISGAHLKAGDRIGIGFNAANHDPAKFPDPERFDVSRKPVGHLGFGYGVHACAGQMVARMEADILFGMLARRVREIRLVGTPVRDINNSASSWQVLPLELVPNDGPAGTDV